MAIVYQDGITVNTSTGQILGVGNLTGNGQGNNQNSGAVKTSSKPTITVNGQRISGNDPNYDAYAAQNALDSGQKLASSQIPLGGYVPGGDRSVLPAIGTNPEFNKDVYKKSVISPSGVETTIINKNAGLNSVLDNTNRQSINDNIEGAAKRFGVDYSAEKGAQEATSSTNIKSGQKLTYDQWTNLQKTTEPGKLEGMIRRGTDGSIYLGSLQMEKNAFKDYTSIFGIPKNASDWKKFNDYAYGGKLPNASGAPAGAKAEVPDTQVPAAPEIAADDGTIDPLKLIEKVEADLKSINSLINSTQEDIDNTTTAYDNSINEIGHELGTVAPLIQGEQAYQENRKQIALQAKEKRLARLVDEKANVIEEGNLKLKIYDYTRQLRQDQQSALETILSSFLNAGVPISNSIAEQYSKLTGIDAKALEDGFVIAASNYLAQNSLSNSTTDYKNYLLAGGFEGTGKTFEMWLNGDKETDVANQYSIERAQRTLTNVKNLYNKVSGWNVGYGSLLKYIPQTDAANFDSELDTLKSNIAFGELAAMRAASQTGGALGQVSDREGKLLESALGALNSKQSPENFKKNLLQIQTSIETWLEATNAESGTDGEFSW